MYVYVCVYVRVIQKYIVAIDCVCPLIDRVWMCVVRDIEVHEKLIWPKDGKYTNFVTSMSEVFAGCDFAHARLRAAVSCCLKLSVANVWEIQEYVGGCCFRGREINRFPNARFIFARDVVENTDTWLFCLSKLLKPLILFWRLTIFVSWTIFLQVSFGFYFSRIFHSMCSSLVGLKYRRVNPINVNAELKLILNKTSK